MSGAAPLRFLAAVVGLWVAFRVIALTPLWEDAAAVPMAAIEPIEAPLPAPVHSSASSADPFVFGHGIATPRARWVPGMRPTAATQTFEIVQAPSLNDPPLPPSSSTLILPTTTPAAPARLPRGVAIAASAYRLPPLLGAPTPSAAEPRLAASAWLFLREGGSTLAPGGTLGGSQAGARLRYRLNSDPRRPLALSARLHLPVDRPEGAEAAAGIDWRPFAALPLHLLAERRERLGRDGRSDFALTLYGGGERRVGRVRVEAYAQAGIVGLEEGDLFADGAIRAGVPLGPVELGAGAWGGAQPGAARLDMGPQVTARLPLGRGSLRVYADWRFRVAGDAAPGSGPALTIATDF